MRSAKPIVRRDRTTASVSPAARPSRSPSRAVRRASGTRCSASSTCARCEKTQSASPPQVEVVDQQSGGRRPRLGPHRLAGVLEHQCARQRAARRRAGVTDGEEVLVGTRERRRGVFIGTDQMGGAARQDQALAVQRFRVGQAFGTGALAEGIEQLTGLCEGPSVAVLARHALPIGSPSPPVTAAGLGGRLHSAGHGVWRSLVAHPLWERGAVGSNPATPTASRRVRGCLRSRGCRGSSPCTRP
jgi:hypothetical protein